MLWTPNKPIFETKNVPHKIGPWKFRYQGQIALYGPPGDPEGARYQVKVCGHHETNPDGSMGGSWDQIWPLGALRGPPGPPKGAFRAKTVPFRTPRGPEGADTRSKCVVTMSPTQTGQWEAVGTKSGPPGPSEDLRGPQKGHSGPK